MGFRLASASSISIRNACLVREMQCQPSLLGTEDLLEDAYLGPRLRGGKADSLPIQMLLKIPVNLVCRVHSVTLP